MSLRKLPAAGALLVWLVSAPSVVLAADALIVHDGSTISPMPDVRTNLQNRLTAKGYTVTLSNGVPAGSLSSYQQVWDVRIGLVSGASAPFGSPLTATETSQYLAFLSGGGSLFLMGENGSSFGPRNMAIRDFIQSVGGGTVALAAGTTSNNQTVQSPFTGPTAVAAVTYSSVGGVTSLPKGQFITKDTATSGAAISLGPGTMTGAPAGTLIAVFDVNFLGSAANADLQALVGNIISYLGAPPAAANADLAITKTQSTSAPAAGDNLTYTVTVTNNGPSDASTVSVSDPLPANTTFVSASGPAGWTLSTPAVGANGTVSATRATLANGSGAQTFTITVKVNAAAATGTVLANTATVSTSTTDPTASNNTASVSATTTASADLSVTKTQSTSVPAPGANLTYTVIVTNNGPSDASTVSLSDPLPAGTTFVSASGPAGWTLSTPAAGATGTVSATLATLTSAAGAQTFTITVKVDAAAANGTSLPNTATVSTSTTDPTSGNNSSSVSATVTVTVPTMGEWGMILLALALAGVGIFSMRNRADGMTPA